MHYDFSLLPARLSIRDDETLRVILSIPMVQIIAMQAKEGRPFEPTQQRFPLGLEPFYGCDGCQAIAHTVLVEQAGARVCGVVFQ